MSRYPNAEDDLSRPRYGERAAAFTDMVHVPVGARDITVPPLLPDPGWHRTALMLWESFVSSPVSASRWVSTDWAVAWVCCAELSAHYLNSGRRGAAAMFGEIVRLLSMLGLTDAERRRMRIELDFGSSTDAAMRAAVAAQMADVDAIADEPEPPRE